MLPSDVRPHSWPDQRIDSLADPGAGEDNIETWVWLNDSLHALKGCPTGMDEYWSYCPAEINKLCVPLIAVFVPV